MSESNAVQIKYVPEVTLGVTPADDNGWKDLRYISDSLTGSPEVQTSDESRADRNISDQFITGINTQGDVSVELHRETYDDFLEAAMCGTWASDALRVGTIDRSFSMEKQFTDLAGFKAVNFTGMRVATAELSFAYGSAVTGTFNFAGLAYSINNAASLVGTGTSAAVNSNKVIQAGGNLGSLQLDNAATGIIFKDMTVNINNNMRAITGVGSNFAQDQRKGRAIITGTINMYLDDEAWAFLAHSLNQTGFGLEWTVSDGTGGLGIEMPNLRLSGELPNRPGPDQDVMFSANYTALYDATAQSSLVLTRGAV